ncbi:hypothetical protein ACP70R_023367 [Stipagrostis hirtigluma subsp. patula]
MSASENQAAETSKDTSFMKIGPPGNRIRIRLPPRKRLSDGLHTLSMGVPDDGKDLPGDKVPEQINNSTENTNLRTTAVKVEKASSDPPEEGLFKEGSSSNLSKMLSRDMLSEEANFTIPSNNLAATTGMQERKNSWPEVKGLCKLGNKGMLNKGLPSENGSNIPIKESYAGIIKNTPSKNLAITQVQGEVEKYNTSANSCEDAGDNSMGKRLLCDTNINTLSNGEPEEAKIKNQGKNLTTSAAMFEEANVKYMTNCLFQEASKNIPIENLCIEARNTGPNRRPADPANDKTSNKKLRTSVVQASNTSQNTSGMKLVTSVGQATANLEATKEYNEFEEKVRRTVYLDNLSPLTTEAVIKMALNQFGSVRKVDFLLNYTVPYEIPQSALIEMETEKDAESVVNMLHEFPFMISGMPRPVRGKRATAEMFNDRPSRPGRKLGFSWIGPKDPFYEDARKFKLMCKRHEVENLALIKHQLEEEELLAIQQQDNLSCDYKKLEAIDSVILNGWVNCLCRIYNFSFDEVF